MSLFEFPAICAYGINSKSLVQVAKDALGKQNTRINIWLHETDQLVMRGQTIDFSDQCPAVRLEKIIGSPSAASVMVQCTTVEGNRNTSLFVVFLSQESENSGIRATATISGVRTNVVLKPGSLLLLELLHYGKAAFLLDAHWTQLQEKAVISSEQFALQTD